MSNFIERIEASIKAKKLLLNNQNAEEVIDAFRKGFDIFEQLVVLHRKNQGRKGFEKTAYTEISDQLFTDGYKRRDGEKLTKDQVGHNMKIVRDERSGEVKTKKSSNLVSEGLTTSHSSTQIEPVLAVLVEQQLTEDMPAPIAGYSCLKEFEKWFEGSNLLNKSWDDASEILYGQLRIWFRKKFKTSIGESLLSSINSDTEAKNFQIGNRSLGTAIQKFYEIREKNNKICVWKV